MELSAGDKLRIDQLEISARLGVTSEERAEAQRIVLNLTVWPEADFGRLQDDITRTVNYVELCHATRDLLEKQEWNLIETIASTLASDLLGRFPLNAVEVEVRKFVLPNTKYVAAIAQRGAGLR